MRINQTQREELGLVEQARVCILIYASIYIYTYLWTFIDAVVCVSVCGGRLHRPSGPIAHHLDAPNPHLSPTHQISPFSPTPQPSKFQAYDNPAETLQRIKRQLLVTRHFKEVRASPPGVAACLSICLSVCLPACLLACLYVCLSVNLA